MLDLKTIIFFGAYSIKNISEKSNVLAHPITMLVPTPKFQHEYQSQTSGSQQKRMARLDYKKIQPRIIENY